MVKQEVKNIMEDISKIEWKIMEVQACLFSSKYFQKRENVEIVNQLLSVTTVMLTSKKMELLTSGKINLRRIK